MSQFSRNGFTMIELLICAGIVAILATIAYPSYQSYLANSRRTACMVELSNLAQAMEQYYTLNNTYTGASTGTTTAYGAPNSNVFPSECPSFQSTKYYDLQVLTPNASNYILRAVPKGQQLGDGFIQLTANGDKSWDKDNDGAVAEVDWEGG